MDHSATIGVAIIGLGTVGRRFTQHFADHARFELVAGFDVNEDARLAAERDFSLPMMTDPDALIADPSVELVYVATPPLHHERYVDAALAARTPIFCEKPLGVDNHATASMVERVEASGVPAAVNFVFGAAPAAVELIRQVRAGACGQVRGADLRLHFARWPRDWQAGAAWLRDRDQGGWIREVVSHYVFLANRLFGSVTVVHSSVDYPEDGASEHGALVLLDGGGVPIRIVGTGDAAGNDEISFTVRGSERSFRLSDWYRLQSAASNAPWQSALDDERAAPSGAYQAQLDQVAAMVDGQVHSLSTFTQAFEVQRVIEAIIEEGS